MSEVDTPGVRAGVEPAFEGPAVYTAIHRGQKGPDRSLARSQILPYSRRQIVGRWLDLVLSLDLA